MRRRIYQIITLIIGALVLFACRDPEAAAKHYAEGDALYTKQDLAGALAEYRAAAAADADHKAARVAVGRTLYYQREYAQAATELQTAVDREPCHIHARIWLARAQSLLPEGKDAALETVNAGLACGPSIELWRLQGMLYEGRGELSAALAAYRAAIFEAESGARAAVQLAELYKSQNQAEAVKQAVETARRLAGADPTIELELKRLQ